MSEWMIAQGLDEATVVGWAWCASAALVGLVCGWVFLRGSRWPSRLAGAAGVAVFFAAAALVWQPSAADAGLVTPLPEEVIEGGYVSSDTCRSCHPGAYASWHHSFHRTMTQVATPAAVVAPFDGRVLTERGHSLQLARRGDAFYVRGLDDETPLPIDDAWFEEATRVVMTTGSHHMQAYWFENRAGRLMQVPFVYLIREGRWLANSDSFLEPPHAEDDGLVEYTWSDSCVTCHSTGGPWDGREEYVDTTPEMRITELGIACEACHGPAAEHVATNRSPARRYARRLKEGRDATIVNPARLDHERSASICGRCHSVHPDGQGARVHEFRPGELLDSYLSIGPMLQMTDEAHVLQDVNWLPVDERDTVGSFWIDGGARVAGREHSAMIRSGCYLEGEMDCTSCHSMHEYEDRASQLRGAPDDDAMCTECHADVAARGARHTHHAADSPGSRCVNCHMPYTAYALLMATRSHVMDSPAPTGRVGRSRPNACNLCHLDRSIGWTAVMLGRWYGTAEPEAWEREDSLAAGVHWMLRGDATQRAIAAWHMGWGPAQRATRDTAQLEPVLRSLLGDPYPAVRQVAATALMRRDPSLGLDLDRIASEGIPHPLEDPTLAELAQQRNETRVAIPE